MMSITRFIIRCLIFILPIFLWFFGLELYVRHSPNTFALKAKSLHQHLDRIEMLVLGSSHSQNSINPEYFRRPSVNLAYGHQGYRIDSALFFKYAPKLPKLQVVVLELDYHSLEFDNQPHYFRLPWYSRYYDIDLVEVEWLHDLSLYSTSPIFFNNYLKSTLAGKNDSLQINSHGFITKGGDLGYFDKLKYDSLKIRAYCRRHPKNRHHAISNTNLRDNKRRLNSILKYCKRRNIIPILISNPYYSIYSDSMKPKNVKRRKHYIDSLTQDKNRIFYLNFERHSLFTVNDYSDIDHLNYRGAQKFSLLLRTKIDSIVSLRPD